MDDHKHFTQNENGSNRELHGPIIFSYKYKSKGPNLIT